MLLAVVCAKPGVPWTALQEIRLSDLVLLRLMMIFTCKLGEWISGEVGIKNGRIRARELVRLYSELYIAHKDSRASWSQKLLGCGYTGCQLGPCTAVILGCRSH